MQRALLTFLSVYGYVRDVPCITGVLLCGFFFFSSIIHIAVLNFAVLNFDINYGDSLWHAHKLLFESNELGRIILSCEND